MVAVTCLIVEMTLADVIDFRYTEESDKRELIVRPKHTSQYILGCCHVCIVKRFRIPLLGFRSTV